MEKPVKDQTKTAPKEQRIVFSSEDFKISITKKQSEGYAKNFHEELEIKYYYEGSSAVMIDREVLSVKSGDIVIVNPYEIHTNVNMGSYDGKYYLLILDLDFFAENSPKGLSLRNELITNGKKFVNKIENDNRLSKIIVKVFEEITLKKEYYKMVVVSLMTEFFALLLRERVNADKQREKKGAPHRRAELIAPALSKIFRDYQKEITIEDLAKECNISKFHFCRVFKEEMKVTPIVYLNNYRISIAEVLLKERNMTLSEIAEGCGFNDVSYFYRCYKSVKGYSPTRKNF